MRAIHNAPQVATTFNSSFQPEIILEHNDPFQAEWIDESCPEDIIVGEKVPGTLLASLST